LGVARILVTGAVGFIGSALCPLLAARGHKVIPVLRATPFGQTEPSGLPPQIVRIPTPGQAATDSALIGEITPETDWSGLLEGIDVVVHLAQRAHRRALESKLAAEPQAAASLARGAAQAGVRRMLYMSSIKAMGETTSPGRGFRADDPTRPEDAYGRAKLASERALAAVADKTGLDLVILRPPLVYGPRVAGNFRALVRLAATGLPLPFAALDNRRSLIFRDNLVDLVAAAALHPAAAGRVLLARDGLDLSTPALIRILAQGQGRPARLFALPAPVFAMLRRLPGLGPAACRLSLSLQVDDSATCAVLGWMPPVAAEPALLATARAVAGRQGG
jgi:nucleoside-diphosphate-sugar epimerase